MKYTLSALMYSFVFIFASPSTIANTYTLNVVELFTSQGCSSCPRADRHLGELAKKENTIVLSCHVTYWNYLGWKDPLSLDFCDSRQRDYAKKFGLRSAYTPQMIINGRYERVGSDRKAIGAILNTELPDQVQELVVGLDQQRLTISANKDGQLDALTLYVFGLDEKQTHSIKRGENGGRQLTYHHPVIQYYNLGTLKLGKKPVTQAIEHNSMIQMWVVIAQDNKTGHIEAAGSVTVPLAALSPIGSSD